MSLSLGLYPRVEYLPDILDIPVNNAGKTVLSGFSTF